MFEHHAPTTTTETAPSLPAARVLPHVTRTIARVSSTNLLSGSRELVIEHAGQEYHLRLTRNDKLILTK